jgi:hypothetical protein
MKGPDCELVTRAIFHAGVTILNTAAKRISPFGAEIAHMPHHPWFISTVTKISAALRTTAALAPAIGMDPATNAGER